MSARIRYRRDCEGTRFKVVMLGKWEGFVVRWSQHCSGCTEKRCFAGHDAASTLYCRATCVELLRSQLEAQQELIEAGRRLRAVSGFGTCFTDRKPALEAYDAAEARLKGTT